MKLQKYLTACTAFGLIAISGCATFQSEPKVARVDNSSYLIEMTPNCDGSCESFALHVTNKSDANIELDWNKTLYVVDGQTEGGFLFEGIIYRDRNMSKLPDVVFPKGEFKKTIYPSNNVSINDKGEWKITRMGLGNHGIFITLIVDGKVVTERLSAKLFKVEKKNKVEKKY